MKKNKWFHVADNTVLDCPTVNYKYNYDSYKREKTLFWYVSIIGIAVAIVIISVSNNSIIQTIAGAFMGGLFSLVVWLFTIRQQDKMNYELANVDLHIMHIEKHLDYQNNTVKFINPEMDEIVQADDKSIIIRFMHLFQLVVMLNGDENIDTTQLMLKTTDKDECSLKEYIAKCNDICMNRFQDITNEEERWEKIISWNNFIIDWRLDELKRKLLRYKYYITCGNVPQNYKEFYDKNKQK